MALASPFAPSLSAPFCSTYTESTRSTSTALSHSHQIRSFSLTARGFFSPKKVDVQYDLSHRFSRQCRLKGQPATEQVQARKSVIPAAAAAAGGDTANGGGVGANEVSATARYLRMSADKARRVIDQIRGRTYEEVLMILELMPYRACYPIFRLVYSAASNGSHNLGFNKADLVVSNAQVNVGPTMKRNRAKARGQSSRIKKRTCHITIVLKNTA